MKTSFVRGAYLNNFEGQNFPPSIIGYSSLFPIDSRVPFPVIRLICPADLQRISVLNTPIKYIANRTWGDVQVLFGLEKYILDSDVVHVGDPHYYYSYQAAVLRSKNLIKKLVSTWWETIPFNNESTNAKKRIKKYSMQYIDQFLCYSQKAKECLIAEGISEKKITVISLGVDESHFYPTKEKKSNIFTILFVGRLVEEKGIMDVYNVFKEIAHSIKDIRLKIVGQGPLEQQLMNLIKKDNLQNKVSLTHQSYSTMPEVYRGANILCVPSKKTQTWEEQYGMVFIEAMASGLPIVSYQTGAIPEIVQDAGLLAGENNLKELKKYILDLYTNKQLCHKIGTMGRERAEKIFNAHNTRKRIKTFYRQV
jgi:glycosyltransferase involved in cell wall biosynthesis